jgi:hypothetical protein
MAAARTESENNLRQIAVAANHYQSATGYLPNNKTLLDPNNPTTRPYSSVFVKLLPYVEQDNLYQTAIKQGIRCLDISTVKTYISPADASSPIGTAAFSSYVANDLIFGIRQGATLPRSVPDGLSNTILFTEHYMAAGSPPVYSSWVIAVDGIPINKQRATRVARLLSTEPPQFAQPQMCSPDPASTPHTSGILTAMADGSVSSVSRGAASAPTAVPGGGITNWKAALTPDGGETLGPDW